MEIEPTMPPAPPRATILIVDDVPANVALLVEIFRPLYRTIVATQGHKALAIAASGAPPDLILLDVLMPGIDGHEVCRRLKASPTTRSIPVIFVTSRGEEQDEAKGLATGGVDYVTKPIAPAIVLARVKTHLAAASHAKELESLVQKLEHQARELQALNQTLEQRVAQGIDQVQRLDRLKRFFSPSVVDVLLAGSAEDPMKSRRRDVAAVFVDLRGFTAFTESSEPEDVLAVICEYHEAMGELVMAYGGTVERFAGDGIMVYFNDPVEVANPAAVAVRMAIDMQRRFKTLGDGWQKRGYQLSMGIGIAQGFATIGAIGFEGRRDYGVIGTVSNLASRLCTEALGGQILVSQRVSGAIQDFANVQPAGDLDLKGFRRPMAAYAVLGYREPVGDA
jgi:class 3 adenylate cyclase